MLEDGGGAELMVLPQEVGRGTPRRTQDLVMPGVRVTRDVIAPTSGAENKSSLFPSGSEGYHRASSPQKL